MFTNLFKSDKNSVKQTPSHFRASEFYSKLEKCARNEMNCRGSKCKFLWMFGMYGHDFISIILYQIDRFRHRTFRLGIFLSKSYACNMQEKKTILFAIPWKLFFWYHMRGGGHTKFFALIRQTFFLLQLWQIRRNILSCLLTLLHYFKIYVVHRSTCQHLGTNRK